MSAYESLAACYDELTYDIPYEKILTFFERLCAREHVQPRSVLDLACGTGSLSLLLARRGYRVIGADLSSDMLAEAEQKAQALPENRPFFICQPMQRLRLAEPVDAVICALDSLNYVTKPADCQKTFRRVYDALTPGGLFVFDINTPEKFARIDGESYVREDDGVFCVWQAAVEDGLCAYQFDIFEQEDDVWHRAQETHEERIYEPAQLTAMLEQAGFTEIKTYGDQSFAPVQGGEDRIYFTARKRD